MPHVSTIAWSHSVPMTLFPLIRIILGAGDHPPLVFMREVEVGLTAWPHKMLTVTSPLSTTLTVGCDAVLSYSVESDSLQPTACSLPGFSVHGILQARILDWVAIPFFRGSS